MIEKLKNTSLNLQSTSVYNFNEFSLTELLNKFFSTINQCVDISNTSLEFLTWLKGEGLPSETIKELNNMYNDGRLTDIIDNMSGNLNSKIENNKQELNNELIKVNTQLEQNTQEIENNKQELNNELIKVNTQLEQNTQEISNLDNNKAGKDITNNLQSQISNLVVNGNGSQNLEVIQARVDNQGNSFPTLKDNIDNISNLIFNNEFKISFSDWVQGAIQTDGIENNDSKFIRTNNFHIFNEIVEVIPSVGINYRITKYDLSGNMLSNDNFITTKTILPKDETLKYKITIGKIDATVITPNESGLLIMKVDRNIKYNEYGATFITTSKNLVDVKNIKLNTLINATTGLEETNSTYACTDFIPYKLGQELYVSRYRNYVMYDKNRNKLLVNTTTTTEKTLIKITSSSMVDVAYVRFSVYKEFANNTMVSYTDFTTNDEYGLFIDKLRINSRNISNDFESYLNTKLSGISESVSNPLISKRILNLGDSISAGDGNNGIGVAEIIANRNNMTVYDYAKGGATVTETTVGGNNIINQINNALYNNVTCDYILFNGLTNDINSGNVLPIGTISDGYSDTLDKSTFCGALEYICKTLKTQWLGAKILYFRPHNMSSRSLTEQKTYGEKAKEICKKWSVPYVDLFEEGGLNSNISAMRIAYTNNSDGTHPNELGYLTYYVPQIEIKLKSV